MPTRIFVPRMFSEYVDIYCIVYIQLDVPMAVPDMASASLKTVYTGAPAPKVGLALTAPSHLNSPAMTTKTMTKVGDYKNIFFSLIPITFVFY